MSTMSLQDIRAGLVARHEAELRQVDAVIAMAQGLTAGASTLMLPEANRKLPPSTPLHWRRHPVSGRPGKPAAAGDTRVLNALIRAHEKLPERFKPAEVGRQLGLSNPSTAIWRWKTKGLIRAVGDGFFERTEKWLGLMPAPGVPSSGNRGLVTKRELEDQLGTAIGKRDAANGRGNADEAKAAQKEIDRLEKLLESRDLTKI